MGVRFRDDLFWNCLGSSSPARFGSSRSRVCDRQQRDGLHIGLSDGPWRRDLLSELPYHSRSLALCRLQDVMVTLHRLALGGRLLMPVAPLNDNSLLCRTLQPSELRENTKPGTRP
jgi:hypothetical protein